MLSFPGSTYCSYILVKWGKILRYPAVWLVLTLRRRTTSFWELQSCDFKLRLDWTFLKWRQLCLHVCSCEALDQTGSGLCHIIDSYISVCLQLWLSLEINFLCKLKEERFWIDPCELNSFYVLLMLPAFDFELTSTSCTRSRIISVPWKNFEGKCADLI